MVCLNGVPTVGPLSYADRPTKFNPLSVGHKQINALSSLLSRVETTGRTWACAVCLNRLTPACAALRLEQTQPTSFSLNAEIAAQGRSR